MVPSVSMRTIEIYWETNELGDPVHLVKTDTSKPDKKGVAVVDKGVLDVYFRDEQGFLFGIVPERYVQELKKFYKRRQV